MELFIENNASVHAYHDSSVHKVVICVTFVPMALIICLGNMFVILTVLSRARLRRQNYYILTSLAVNDFLMGCISMPLEAYLRTVRNAVTCTLRTAEYFYMWSYVFMFGSLTHLLLISSDRYIALTLPLRYESVVTTGRIAIALIVAWCIPLLYGIARASVNDQKELFLYSYCLGERTSTDAASIVFDLMVPFSVLLVGFVLIVLNIRILLIAIRQANQIAEMARALEGQHSPGHSAEHGMRHVKAAKIILSMVFAFIICFVPLALFLGLARMIQSDIWYVTADDVAYLLAAFSSAANPIIYCSRDRVFRENAIEFVLSLKATALNIIH